MPTAATQLWPPLLTAFQAASRIWRSTKEDAPKPFIDTSYRPNEVQQKLYNQGRTTKGPIVTNARPGQSLHNYNPAYCFDIAFQTKDGKCDWSPSLFDEFAAIMRDVAPWIAWGGEWKSIKDRPHFEIRGFTWEDARAGRQPTFR